MPVINGSGVTGWHICS